jgi:hypothetical protein
MALDRYLEDRKRDLVKAGETFSKGPKLGPQGTSGPKASKPDRRSGDSGVKINAKNVQVTRTGLERRKRSQDQRSTRGYGGRG